MCYRKIIIMNGFKLNKINKVFNSSNVTTITKNFNIIIVLFNKIPNLTFLISLLTSFTQHQ